MSENEKQIIISKVNQFKTELSSDWTKESLISCGLYSLLTNNTNCEQNLQKLINLFEEKKNYLKIWTKDGVKCVEWGKQVEGKAVVRRPEVRLKRLSSVEIRRHLERRHPQRMFCLPNIETKNRMKSFKKFRKFSAKKSIREPPIGRHE